MAKNLLFYGDNLDILRRHIEDESVDLIYLDPPFNSQQDYNVLFQERNGSQSDAQFRAFEDTWRWDLTAEEAYRDVVEAGGTVSRLLQGMRQFMGENDMLAYLSMMAPRLKDLHRVLKPTGSIYLHCDPAASHYLKLLLDAIFGPLNFRNEIVWKRTSGHSDARRCGNVHDTLLFFTKSDDYTWNAAFQAYDPEYVDRYYRYQDEDGRRFMSGDLSASGLSGGGYEYEWKGITRVWRCPRETMERLDREGRIFYTRNDIARMKRYLDEASGMPLQDVWRDIQALRSWHAERLGYPTQKPEALLGRIISASSNEGDMVLDPFCGCGTAIMAAQKLNRRWIGIDITHLAIGLIRHRLRDAFGEKVMEEGKTRPAVDYDVVGDPKDLSGAEALFKQDHFEFQWWALGMVGARRTDEKRGADQGIDGRLYFHDEPQAKKTKQIILQVKGGQISPSYVRDLRGVVEREDAQIGVLITLQEPTRAMRAEAASAGFYKPAVALEGSFPRIQLLTVGDLLEGKRIQYPPQTSVTFKKAPRAKRKAHRTKDMFEE